MSATASASPAAPPLQSLQAIQAALRKTTETLAREIANPGTVTPAWSEPEWLVARAAASLHGVSPLLARTLRWREAPPGWNRFLHEQRAHTENRYRRIQELLGALDAEARRTGIALVALKGAALHALGIYVPGERPMADVDLLAHERDMEPTGRSLETLGFRETYRTWRHRVFEPAVSQPPAVFGESASNGMKIELHARIGERLPLWEVDVSKSVYPLEPHPGLNRYPSKAGLMTHLLLHAAGAMAFRAVRLLHLNDISRLSVRMSEADWDELLSGASSGNLSHWWAYPPLSLTARYYESCIPDRVLASLRACCPWLLRRACGRNTLSDVSLSYLWVDAFPGIEWARSPREMLEYVANRVAPSAEVKSLRNVIADSQPASASPWARMSQSRRILRWVMSRPARSESLHTVQTALVQSY